jgi:hypothetical protein
MPKTKCYDVTVVNTRSDRIFRKVRVYAKGKRSAYAKAKIRAGLGLGSTIDGHNRVRHL